MDNMSGIKLPYSVVDQITSANLQEQLKIINEILEHGRMEEAYNEKIRDALITLIEYFGHIE